MTVKWSSTGARPWPAVTWLGVPVLQVRRCVRLSGLVMRAQTRWAHPQVVRAAERLSEPEPVR